MKLDESGPANRRVLEHLRGNRGGTVPIMPPDGHPDPYMGLGSHPDVVERVWRDLNGALPKDCRAIVHGTPALVDPDTGVILALAYGTAYAIRVPEGRLEAALKSGCRHERTWTGGSKTDLRELLGPGWVFGAWSEDEPGWLLEACGTP